MLYLFTSYRFIYANAVFLPGNFISMTAFASVSLLIGMINFYVIKKEDRAVLDLSKRQKS